MMSTGLPWLQVAGNTRPRSSIVSAVECGQPPAGRLEGIDGEHPGAAAIGQHDQPIARLLSRERQRLGGIEQLGHGADAQHAGAAEGGGVDRIGAGQHAGMRGGRPRSRHGMARLQHQHRFAPRRGARCRHEFAPVGDPLGIKQDRAGIRVGGEVVEHVAEIDIGHVAERDDMREADAARRRPVEHRGHHRARLADEGNVARRRREMREAGVEPDPRDHDADAVRTDETQQMRARGVERRLLQGASGLAQFAESSRDDDRGLGAARTERGNQAGHRVRSA